MKETRFLQTMRLIDDDLLEEAYTPGVTKPRRRVLPALLAACLCLVIGLGAWHQMDRDAKGAAIAVPEYDFLLELPQGAEPMTHRVVVEEVDIPVLEASFRMEGEVYCCRMANTPEPGALMPSPGTTVGMMDWQTADLSFQYRQQVQEDSWVSWYDAEAQTQWCLSGEDPVCLLTTAELLVRQLGYSMAVAPQGAGQISYQAVSLEGLTVGETRFEWQGVEYAYRMASTPEIREDFADISGLTLSGEETEAQVLWCPARITMDGDGAGKLLWFDVVPGLLYSLTMDGSASREDLLDMAHLLFDPAQEPTP